MKVRFLCAVLGVAISVAAVVFMRGLVATNDAQSERLAERLLSSVPVASDARICRAALDYRPEGRVMQGPPLMVVAATETNALPAGSCRVTRALFAARKLPPPAVGTSLTVVGEKGAFKLKVAEVLDWDRPLRGYPNLFVSPATAATIGETWTPWRPQTAAELAPGFRSDAQRNFDRAKALLLWAAALTALCLLVNSLLLTVEARRREFAILRLVGWTRGKVVGFVASLAIGLSTVGAILGNALGCGALWLFVAWQRETYPLGISVPQKLLAATFWTAIAVALVAALLAIRPALAVRPLEAASARLPRRRPWGMVLSFAFGFGAFVAVEVWGTSLTRPFIPSKTWPDAIVSILPGGVSSFDIEKIRAIPGVRRIAELQPLQVNLDPREPIAGFGDAAPRGGRQMPAYRNALLLASDWLPDFRFVAGDRASADAALRSGDACVITEMMTRAHKLKLGDALPLDCGRGLKLPLAIVGIVDLNWHMVTSRGLVRGMNRMPVHTDGPVFVSFDTLMAADARPQEFVKMTHVWLDFEDAFEAQHGVFGAGRLVERAIAEALDTPQNTVRLHARDEIADGTLAHGDELVGTMAAVPFIFIGVISLGFVALIVASVDARAREFVVMRTVGATRLQLAGVLVREVLDVAWKGLAFGLPGGALVGWLATAGTRAAMSSWGLPACFVLPWCTCLKGALGALAFALVVAVPTALVVVRRATKR